MPLAKAEEIAQRVVWELKGMCRRIEIAGSVRRRKAECGDVEIVCEPISWDGGHEVLDWARRIEGETLFAGPPAGWSSRGAIGQRAMRLLFEGFPIDIFCVLPPAQWGLIFTLRTGPADFNMRLMENARRRGILLRNGRLVYASRRDALETPEEADVFKFCGMPWTEPEARF